MVYDSVRAMEVKTFTDKYGKDLAVELAGILNRGVEVLNEALTSPEKMRSLLTSVQQHKD